MSYDPITQACPEFLADFSDFVDGTVAPQRRSEIQVHLDCCERCLRHLSAYRRGVGAYRDMPMMEVDREEFWLGLRIRLASDLAEPVAPRPIAWRAPAFAAAAVAVMALSVIWVGTRVDGLGEGLGRSRDLPVVVLAGPPTPTLELDSPLVPRPSRSSEQAADDTDQVRYVQPLRVERILPAQPAGVYVDEDPALDREFESLRDEIETAAWLGDPYVEAASATFDPASGSGIRIQTVAFTDR